MTKIQNLKRPFSQYFCQMACSPGETGFNIITTQQQRVFWSLVIEF
jgi:hypothetical protein